MQALAGVFFASNCGGKKCSEMWARFNTNSNIQVKYSLLKATEDRQRDGLMLQETLVMKMSLWLLSQDTNIQIASV